MKKLTAIILCIILAFTFAACGSQNGGNDEPSSNEGVSDTADNSPSETPNEMPSNPTETAEGKTLVVYYSASGNTKNVAEYIATATNGDLFELVPVQPYTDDDLNWRDSNSRVMREHDNPDDRAVELTSTTIDNWDSYDTVFIGYPIWWGIAAWPVDGFITANNFTDKTVIPFCTSSTSGLGESGKLLADAAGTGNWLEGERFSSRASESEVQSWLENLEN